MNTLITYRELIENYSDLEDTYMIDSLKEEIQDGTSTEETTLFINETTSADLDENGQLFDTDGGEPWPYIEGKTFTLTDSTNCFEVGYVYLP